MNVYDVKSTPVQPFVVTVVIITHGVTTSLNIDAATASMFDNVRMYVLSPKFGCVSAAEVLLTRTHDFLKRKYRKNLEPGTSTGDIMREYADTSRPKYEELKQMFGQSTAATATTASAATAATAASSTGSIGNVYDHIPFDKMYSDQEDISVIDSMFREHGFFVDYMGIFVIAVHQRPNNNPSGALELVYPLPHHPNKDINLLNVSHIRDMYDYMNQYANLSISSMIPFSMDDVFHSTTSEEFRPATPNMSIHDMGRQFIKNKHYNPYVRYDGKVVFLRLSQLAYILKYLFGDDVQINLFDYSCSPLEGVSDMDKNALGKYVKQSDIESGYKGFGGTRRRRPTRRRTRKYNKGCKCKNKKKRKSKCRCRYRRNNTRTRKRKLRVAHKY